jgi:hypothetical protein
MTMMTRVKGVQVSVEYNKTVGEYEIEAVRVRGVDIYDLLSEAIQGELLESVSLNDEEGYAEYLEDRKYEESKEA